MRTPLRNLNFDQIQRRTHYQGPNMNLKTNLVLLDIEITKYCSQNS